MKGNLRFKIDWASLKAGRKFTVFALFYFVFESNFQVQAPGGLIFGGASTWRGLFSEFYGIIAKLNRDALCCARVKKAFNISLPKGHYRDKNVQVYPFQTTVCTLSSKTLRIQGNLMAAAENEQKIRLSDLTIICEEKERKPLRHFSHCQFLFDMGARLAQW